MVKQPWDPGSINLCLQDCILAMTLDPAPSPQMASLKFFRLGVLNTHPEL